MAKILFIATDDIEEKEALAEIIRCARDTRTEYIAKMHELKGQ